MEKQLTNNVVLATRVNMCYIKDRAVSTGMAILSSQLFQNDIYADYIKCLESLNSILWPPHFSFLNHVTKDLITIKSYFQKKKKIAFLADCPEASISQMAAHTLRRT